MRNVIWNVSIAKCLNRKIPDLSYKNIERGLRIFYDKGIRLVFIEGGEPFLWKEDGRNLDDVLMEHSL